MEIVLLIEPHYFPCISYFSLFSQAEKVVLDDVSVFRKQSYRNRCRISGANGVQDLIVPLKHGKTKLAFRDVKIDDSIHWRRIHFQSILSAYNKSPFFLHFRDEIEFILFSKQEFLLDLNLKLIERICENLRINAPVQLRSEIKNQPSFVDFREFLHPKPHHSKPIEGYKIIPYWQVFSDRFGFIPELSILDLLCSEGPASMEILFQASRNIRLL